MKIVCYNTRGWLNACQTHQLDITSVTSGDYNRGLVSGAEPILVLGTAPTLLMFGCKGWVGVALNLFFVWLE
jgi:hypothetical protein